MDKHHKDLEQELRRRIGIDLYPIAQSGDGNCWRYHIQTVCRREVELSVAAAEIGQQATLAIVEAFALERELPPSARIFGRDTYFWTFEALCHHRNMSSDWLARMVPEDVRAAIGAYQAQS